ncbi:MAG: 5-formyltetrahydrofolate cyclo-ligase [Clostridia bacterium]|nr:5-formyltetrahydrofolate cyclo-ligase [Clostridia bacterium]
MNEKKKLRALFARERDGLAPRERAGKTGEIIKAIRRTEEFRQAGTVLVYRAVLSEIDLRELVSASGKTFVYPVCEGKDLVAMIPGGWKTGPFGIQEPDPAVSEPVLPRNIDLVICPGLAFDSRLFRLGMGGGFYDRFLPLCVNACFIMPAFECQRTDLLPADPWDVKMHMAVTENGIYTVSVGKTI